MTASGAGRTFGRYRLVAELGRGGMGVVYRAHDPVLDRTVALKVVLSVSGPAAERFLREARALARLDHPGIVAVHDSGEALGVPFLVMDFIEGETLGDRLAGGPLPPAWAADLVRDVARAVQHAHERGVVHRDLKPENILIDRQGAPRVLDFGIARLEGAAGLTRTGAMVGTLAYMAPEQSEGKADARSDVWSLGATLHHLIAGRPPFVGESALEVLGAIAEREVEPSGVDRGLDAIVRRCLAKRPEDRFESAGALADALDRWLEGGRPARRISIALLGGGAGLAAAALALVFLVPRGEAPRAAPPPVPAAKPLLEDVAPPAAVEDDLVRLAFEHERGSLADVVWKPFGRPLVDERWSSKLGYGLANIALDDRNELKDGGTRVVSCKRGPRRLTVAYANERCGRKTLDARWSELGVAVRIELDLEVEGATLGAILQPHARRGAILDVAAEKPFVLDYPGPSTPVAASERAQAIYAGDGEFAWGYRSEGAPVAARIGNGASCDGPFLRVGRRATVTFLIAREDGVRAAFGFLSGAGEPVRAWLAREWSAK